MERISEFINRKWLFAYGQNVDVESTQDFSAFTEIGLPHTFTLPYKGVDQFYVGYGVYVKQLNLTAEDAASRVVLEFGAVFQVADVYCNGQLVCRHEGGYTAFIADLTNIAKEGENTIIVRVNNLWSPVIAPRAGEHTFCGGIYRDVKLIITDHSFIDWYGVTVTTPYIDRDIAKVSIKTETINCIGKTLHSYILDKNQKIVANISQAIESDIVTTDLVIDNPILWNCDNPYLYTLCSAVDEDVEMTTFGVRHIEWSKSKGFFLNGKRLLLQGANVHQDHGGWGDAVTHAGIHRDIKLMKECGMNFIRGSHYPHHSVFADECDRQGIMLWSEGVFWGIGGFGADGYWDTSAMPNNPAHYAQFEKSLAQTLTEMVRQNKNHPSIIAWSIGNEIFFSAKANMDDAKALAARMCDLVKALDTSRLCGIGGVQREGFDKIGDIAGYNGDGAVLYHNPHLPNIVAEYGSIPSFRPGKVSLYETKGSDEYYDWRAGRAVWCGFHHGSIANIGNLGIVDLYRLPLNAYYAYRQKYKNIPVPKQTIDGTPYSLKISADRKEISCDGLCDCMLTIEAFDYSGARVNGEFEITVSIVSGAGLLPTGQVMKFNRDDNSMFDGACAIELRSYYAGEIKVIASAEGLVSGEIVINAVGDEQYNGHKILLPQEPLFIKRKVKRGADIVCNRPITVTSEETKGMSKFITDGDASTLWRPNVTDKRPIITLDLENVYDNFVVMLGLEKAVKTTVKIIASTDKKDWVDITTFKTNIFKKNYKIAINDGKFRFLRLVISCDKQIVGVRSIKAWQI